MTITDPQFIDRIAKYKPLEAFLSHDSAGREVIRTPSEETSYRLSVKKMKGSRFASNAVYPDGHFLAAIYRELIPGEKQIILHAFDISEGAARQKLISFIHSKNPIQIKHEN